MLMSAVEQRVDPGRRQVPSTVLIEDERGTGGQREARRQC